MWLWLAVALALGPALEASPVFATVRAPGQHSELTVLDVSETAVAVRVVSTSDEFEPCDYAGMDDKKVDVRLALFDLLANTRAEWVIYEGAGDGVRCTTFERSQQRLAEAKAAMAAAGLDASKEAEPDGEGKTFSVEHVGRTIPFEAKWAIRRGGVVEGRYDEEIAGLSLEYEIAMAGSAVVRTYDYTLGAMGYRTDGRPPRAWVRGGYVVLLVHKAFIQLGEDLDAGRYAFTRVKIP